MYARKYSKRPALLALVLGLAGLAVRSAYYAAALDARGLLATDHPLGIALWLLLAASFVLIAHTARKAQGSQQWEENYPFPVRPVLGHCAAAVGIYLTVALGTPKMPGVLGAAWRILGFLSLPSLLAAAVQLYRKKQPFFLLRMVPCLFLVMHIVNHYQSWSSEPQMQNYLYALLGISALMLFSFYLTAYDAGICRRRMLMAMGLASICFCLTALPDCGYPWLYLGGAVWALTDLPATPIAHKGSEAPQ